MSMKKRLNSLSVFVDRAIRDELEALRHERIRAAVQMAATDPLFLEDVREVQRDFAAGD